MPNLDEKRTKVQQIIALNKEDTNEIKKKVKKIKKKQPKMLTDEDVMKSRGVILLSHIPKYFQEPQMYKFFSQFGDVTRLKLIRSSKTGNPKGFAFIEFEFKEVANVVAETMDNYLMFQRIMRCRVIDVVKEHTFTGWTKPHHVIPKRTIAIKRHNVKDPAKAANRKERVMERRTKQQEKLTALGIDYDISNLKTNKDFEPEPRETFLFEEFQKLKNNKDNIKNVNLEKSTDAIAVIDEADDEVVLKVSSKMKVQTIKEESVKKETAVTNETTKIKKPSSKKVKKESKTCVESEKNDSKPKTRRSKRIKSNLQERDQTVEEEESNDLTETPSKVCAMKKRKSARLNKSVVDKKSGVTKKRKLHPNTTM